MKRISVIIPMYNSFHMMERNLSVLSQQKDAEMEIIIVDDCSTDDSYTRAKDFASNCQTKVLVVKNEQNGGPGYSRNNGIKHATGDYITFADSDDYFSEDFTKALAPILEDDWDCVVFDYTSVDKEGNLISTGRSLGTDKIAQGEISTEIALVNTKGAPWGKIYKKEIILENNVKFLNLFRSEDLPFTKHAIASSKKIYYCSADLYRYVQLPTSLMHNEDLTDEKNSQIAFSYIAEKISKDKFGEELLAIELKEVLNNTVLIKILKKARRREVVKYIKENYKKEHIKNKYFSGQPTYFKIISYCASHKLIFLLKLICKYKSWKKRKASA